MIKPVSFPKLVLMPRTPHSLPRSLHLETARALREDGFNAFGFLVQDKTVDTLKEEGFHNDHERALADLKAQLPAAVRDKHWPPSSRRDIGLFDTLSEHGATKKSDDEEDDDGASSMGNGLSIGSPGGESTTARIKREEEERQRQSRRRGQGMGGIG